MKSPFTGGNVVLHSEKRTAVFRKEKFEYTFLSYQCVDTRELFTTTELDTANTMQIYNQYRTKYGIPFPDEIRSIRRKYGLSATKMSVILGFGENQYRLYENGDMPSLTNGRILKTIQVPAVFATFVEAAKNLLNTEEYDKIMLCIEELENESNTSKLIKQLIFTTDGRNQWNGYATHDRIWTGAESLQTLQQYEPSGSRRGRYRQPCRECRCVVPPGTDLGTTQWHFPPGLEQCRADSCLEPVLPWR